MILIDTNIIIDYWKTEDIKIKSVILKYPVYICGVVKAELCHGAKNENDFNNILKSLKSFPEIEINNKIWEIIGKNLYQLKNNGLTLPFQDVIIATLAIENSLMIWTKDNHFKKIQSVLNDLQIFEQSVHFNI